MTELDQLKRRIGQIWEQAKRRGDQWDEPADQRDIVLLSNRWQKLIGKFYEEEVIGTVGWKMNWVRAAKLIFLEYVTVNVLWDEYFVLTKSTTVPMSIYRMITSWVIGETLDGTGDQASLDTVSMREVELGIFLLRNKQGIWVRADDLRKALGLQSYTRVPKMSMLDEEPVPA